jgi:complement component 1 Q subcomponent-binding protein
LKHPLIFVLADISLSQKLQQELDYEKTDNVVPSVPDFVTSFKEQGWEIEDTPGQDEVTLTRKFGQEK